VPLGEEGCRAELTRARTRGAIRRKRSMRLTVRRSALAIITNGRIRRTEEERQTVLLGVSQIDGSIPEEERSDGDHTDIGPRGCCIFAAKQDGPDVRLCAVSVRGTSLPSVAASCEQ
jgi:hypothetical protein